MGVDNLQAMLWDVFCRVIDNHGDLGVCWRLAHDLAEQGESVRLWIDEPMALAWLAPRGHKRVAALHWDGALHAAPGDVVIEAFACDPPPAFVRRMAAQAVPPVWINLEYLSAEDYVERSHGLASPQLSGEGQGLTKWFYFPGFTPATGGLLREAHLPLTRQRERLLARGVRPQERAVSVFAYGHAPLRPLFRLLDTEPTAVLLFAGVSQAAALPLFDAWGCHGTYLRCIVLPFMTQREFDEVLTDCDVNVVRGEDSLVRAMWAARPFVWHIYRQDDGAHRAKLDALLGRFDPSPAVAQLWRAFNDAPSSAWPDALPPLAPWAAQCEKWRESLWRQTSLTEGLRQFVRAKR
jgi:uncharacterized repeat protein (TIGR03837 family)